MLKHLRCRSTNIDEVHSGSYGTTSTVHGLIHKICGFIAELLRILQSCDSIVPSSAPSLLIRQLFPATQRMQELNGTRTSRGR